MLMSKAGALADLWTFKVFRFGEESALVAVPIKRWGTPSALKGLAG
jgi:hypothetical protein